MKVMEIQGVVRGGKVITTNPDAAQPCPDDKVNREFVAQMGFVAQIAGRDSRRESKMLPVLHEQTHTTQVQNHELAIL
jgi:hypothetical protein